MDKDQIKRIQELDQSMQTVLDSFPRYWRGMYVRLIEEGFTEDESMDLLFHIISITLGNNGNSSTS